MFWGVGKSSKSYLIRQKQTNSARFGCLGSKVVIQPHTLYYWYLRNCRCWFSQLHRLVLLGCCLVNKTLPPVDSFADFEFSGASALAVIYLLILPSFLVSLFALCNKNNAHRHAEFVPASHQYLLTVLSIWWAFGQLLGSLVDHFPQLEKPGTDDRIQRSRGHCLPTTHAPRPQRHVLARTTWDGVTS